MKAFVVDRYKSKSAVRLGEMPLPEVRDDDVLVQVHAASLNQLDSKIRDGEFKLILPYRLPLILGNDVAGVVVRVGSKARRFKPGTVIIDGRFLTRFSSNRLDAGVLSAVVPVRAGSGDILYSARDAFTW